MSTIEFCAKYSQLSPLPLPLPLQSSSPPYTLSESDNATGEFAPRKLAEFAKAYFTDRKDTTLLEVRVISYPALSLWASSHAGRASLQQERMQGRTRGSDALSLFLNLGNYLGRASSCRVTSRNGNKARELNLRMEFPEPTAFAEQHVTRIDPEQLWGVVEGSEEDWAAFIRESPQLTEFKIDHRDACKNGTLNPLMAALESCPHLTRLDIAINPNESAGMCTQFPQFSLFPHLRILNLMNLAWDLNYWEEIVKCRGLEELSIDGWEGELGLSNESLDAILTANPGMRSLRLQNQDDVNMLNPAKVPLLEVFHGTWVDFRGKALQGIVSSCPHLRDLGFGEGSQAAYSQEEFVRIFSARAAKGLPGLRRLYYVGRRGDADPEQDKIEARDEAIQAAAQFWKGLTSLEIRDGDYVKFSGGILPPIGQNCAELQEFIVNIGGEVLPGQLTEVLRGCPKLTWLDITAPASELQVSREIESCISLLANLRELDVPLTRTVRKALKQRYPNLVLGPKVIYDPEEQKEPAAASQ